MSPKTALLGGMCSRGANRQQRLPSQPGARDLKAQARTSECVVAVASTEQWRIGDSAHIGGLQWTLLTKAHAGAVAARLWLLRLATAETAGVLVRLDKSYVKCPNELRFRPRLSWRAGRRGLFPDGMKLMLKEREREVEWRTRWTSAKTRCSRPLSNRLFSHFLFFIPLTINIAHIRRWWLHHTFSNEASLWCTAAC